MHVIAVLDAYILFHADHLNDNMTHILFIKQLYSNNLTNTVNKGGRSSVAPQKLERLIRKHLISKKRRKGEKQY